MKSMHLSVSNVRLLIFVIIGLLHLFLGTCNVRNSSAMFFFVDDKNEIISKTKY